MELKLIKDGNKYYKLIHNNISFTFFTIEELEELQNLINAELQFQEEEE